jgi:peptidoglycan lytic transglycosylase G
LSDPQEYRTRADRRHATKQERARRMRNALIAAALVVALAAAGFGGLLLYRKVRADRNPPLKVFKILLPEGLNVRQTGEKVAESTEGNISAEEFKAAVNEGDYDYAFLKDANGNLEGFLFPKTYEVTSRTSAHSVVNMLLKQFQVETEHLEWSRAPALGVTPYQVVIIASLIEKEAKVPEDRPLIASVIYNRLKNKMKLGIDATVEYALGQWKPALTNKDLEVDSPYNTYRIPGLPPAPICNPGFESIRAALYPASTNYIYYILTGADGKHSFTADYQEFKRWKEERDRQSP